ncbi:MAG: hypothetical protein GMKNLPBB_01827 [Myxococcota bacterium]|nr:hypothetical protein [Myxococcota bacterium]
MNGHPTLAMLVYVMAATAAIYLSSLAMSLLLAATSPRYHGLNVMILLRSRSSTLAAGMLFALQMILLSVLFARLGAPGFAANVILIGLALGAGIMGLSCMSYVAGRRVLRLAGRENPSRLACIAVGHTVIFLAGLIPVLGWLTVSYAVLTGVGAVMHSLYLYARHRRSGAWLDLAAAAAQSPIR